VLSGDQMWTTIKESIVEVQLTTHSQVARGRHTDLPQYSLPAADGTAG
jgi:hypothetical protein